MDRKKIRKLLPEKPPEGLIDWAKRNLASELGGDYLVYESEFVPVLPTLEDMMEYNSLKPKKVRAARCTCTVCGESIVTQWISGGGIRIIEGDDGSIYETDPDGDISYDGTMIECISGDRITCPSCFHDVELIRSSHLRGGRTKMILVVAVQTIGAYTALIYWMVRKHFDVYGAWVDAYPRDAYVLSERGALIRYSHTTYGGYTKEIETYQWELASKCTDTLEKTYHDWGSICNRKKGGVLYPVIPDLTGTTGEKTGLAAFCKHGDENLFSYLKVWKKLPAIENLLNTGWGRVVCDLVDRYRRGYDVMTEAKKGINVEARKPNEMLQMSKADFRELSRKKADWDLECQELFVSVRLSGMVSGAVDFCDKMKSFGVSGIRTVCDLNRLYGDATFDRVQRYLDKQHLRYSEVGLLLDTRRIARELDRDRELTHEERWPRDLVAAHDRLSELQIRRRKEKERTRYQAGFDAVLKKYEALQWTDGDLCVVLPKCEEDLIQEGKVLRHCVGGYGKTHAGGKSLIFFIRHHRRPERSYYTLNISMTGDAPREIQLHGYGNERHGKNKEHTHRIPQKVRAFCDRWEKEILMPWYEAQKKTGEKERKTA